MRISSFLTCSLATSAFLCVSPVQAAVYTPDQDKFLTNGEVAGGSATAPSNTSGRNQAKLSTRSSTVVNNRRVSIVHFDISGNTVSTSSGSSLVLQVNGLAGSPIGDVQVWGVSELPTAVSPLPVSPSELTLVETDYFPANANALDGIGNGVRETYTFGGTPLDIQSFNFATNTNGTFLTFSGVAFDSYLDSRIADDNINVSFLVTFGATTPVEANQTVEFTSRELQAVSGGLTPVAPTLTVVPEPATLALAGLGGLFMMRRRKA